MRTTPWSNLSLPSKEALLQRKEQGTPVEILAVEVGMNAQSLDRRLREYKKSINTINTIQVSGGRPLPSYEEVFGLIKTRPYTLGELAGKYDRSPDTIKKVLGEMRAFGYVFEEEGNRISFDVTQRPKIQADLPKTLADEAGQVVTFAVSSDLHAGSAFSQPTNRARFIKLAYEEYGVRHFFDPGDKMTGIGGYRGQEHDLIPPLRGLGTKGMPVVTEKEIWLADAYTPNLPGAKYFLLGGNHDYWQVVNTGIDGVAKLCSQRSDMVYLGYDVADIPLTDRVDVRLWHPSGGIPYSKSYRLQKGIEQMAFDELSNAIEANDNPKMRILLAGHLHIEVKFNAGPFVAAHVGCFEGQTNYLKRKALYPQIGGCIFRVWLTDGGLLQRIEYTFVPFTEIHNDWENWPIPEVSPVLQDPDELDVLFKVREPLNDFPSDQRPA